MIDGRTRLIGLMGWPVEHSFSPQMHNAAFAALGLNWQYVPLPVPPGQVMEAVRGLAALGFRGANVTVPHKQAVLSALTDLDPDAEAVGAVNTLVIEYTDRTEHTEHTKRPTDAALRVMGYNTDVQGFVDALRWGGFALGAARQVVVVGAGGAARAVVYGLLQTTAATITVLNRSPERAERLVVDLGARLSAHGQVPGRTFARLQADVLDPATLVASAQDADLLVNATTVGMGPHADHNDGTIWPTDVPLPAHLTVCDLVYNPPVTMLLRQARQAGATTIGGIGMLVAQGARAFEHWTGLAAPVAVMWAACASSLSDDG